MQIDETTVPLRAPAKAIVALAYLAAHAQAPVARDFLAALLWPDAEREDGRANLRRHLHVLVQALPKAEPSKPYLLTTMKSVRWNRDADADVDTIAFAQASADERLDDATAWYGGDFLEGHDDEWVLSERERLRSLQIALLQTSIRRKRSARDFLGALADISRVFTIDPWREDVLRIEMSVRSRLGDRTGALAAYRMFVDRLGAELNVQPTLETRAAFDMLVRDERLTDEGLDLPVSQEADQVPRTLPFVGRETEFDALSRAWASAARGKGSLVLLSGEAGAGKSRLSYELGLHVESQGGGVLVGTTTPAEDEPYGAVVDALRNALSLIIPSRTPEQLGTLARVLPEITARASIVDMPAAAPIAERARIFEAAYASVQGLAQKRPLLVVLEDLHWATASSIALIEYVARRIGMLAVLVVATYREEEVGRNHALRRMRRQLESEGVLERIVLGRFQRATVREIVRRVIADSEDPEAITSELYDYSEGVPLFLDAAIYSARGPRGGDHLHIPERVQRLGDSARALLEMCAVSGTGFSIDLLCGLLGWDETEVLQALDELLEARFVRQGKRRRYGDYAFSHHLVHAAVYAAIPENVRRQQHALVAHASSKLYAGRPDRAGEIAFHYDRAGDVRRAALAYAAAAAHARQLYANDEALAYADRAVALGADTTTLIEMQVLRAWAGESLGRADIRASALDALDRCDVPPERMPEVERLHTIHATMVGQLDSAKAAAQRFLTAALATGDGSCVAQAHIDNALVAIYDDRYEEAEEHLRHAAHGLPLDGDGVRLRLLRAQTFLMERRGIGNEQVADAAQMLLVEAKRVGDPQAEAEAHSRLAQVATISGRFADARAEYDLAIEAYRHYGSPRGVAGIDLNAANLALWSADYGEAQRLYRKCLLFANDDAAETFSMVCTIGLTLASLYTRDIDEATARIRSVAHLISGRQILEEANWHLCSALIATESGDAETAVRSYDAALAIHRQKQPALLYAITLAFAILQTLDAGATPRSFELGRELERMPEELRSGEEFPHLMLWAQSRVVGLTGDADRARALLSAADRLYDSHAHMLGQNGAAYALVPWNARFLAARGVPAG